MQQDHGEIETCIRNCMECHQLCLQTIVHCLGMGGQHASQDHIGRLNDCAQICQLSADFMLRNSPHHPHTCRECAEICGLCADDCERLANGDQHMLHCAEVCRRCADSCRMMSQTTA